jgi:hypothetical protein
VIEAFLPLTMFLQLAEPARTVNGSELGPAEEFSTVGPATVCLRNLVIRAGEGDSIQLSYSGIHNGTLRLILANGESLEVTEGEIFVDRRKRRQRIVWQQTGMEFYRVDRRGAGVEYQIEGSGRVNDGEPAPRAFLTGEALTGAQSDRDFVQGLSFEDPDAVKCDRRYQYGWGVILGAEPLDTRSDDAVGRKEN